MRKRHNTWRLGLVHKGYTALLAQFVHWVLTGFRFTILLRKLKRPSTSKFIFAWIIRKRAHLAHLENPWATHTPQRPEAGIQCMHCTYHMIILIVYLSKKRAQGHPQGSIWQQLRWWDKFGGFDKCMVKYHKKFSVRNEFWTLNALILVIPTSMDTITNCSPGNYSGK